MAAVSRARAPSSHSAHTAASFSPRSHRSSDCSRVRPPVSSRFTTLASSSLACSYVRASRSFTAKILLVIHGGGQLVFGEPDGQPLTGGEFLGRPDDGPVGVLGYRIAAAEGRGGGEREQRGAGVGDIVARPGQARVERLAGGRGGGGGRRAPPPPPPPRGGGARAGRAQPGLLAVEPAAHVPPRPVA